MNFEARLDRTIGNAIEGGRIVGAVTIVGRDGEIVYRKAAGQFDREAGVPMFPEAVFRLASVTKPIVATTALAMVERGLLGLDNAVADHLPWFRPKLRDGTQPRITIRHLLTHTSGMSYDLGTDPRVSGGLQATDMGLEENFALYAETVPLAFPPGTAWAYGVSIDILGAAIARIHGATLADAVAHYVTGPLGMADTGFAPPADPARLAVPYADGPPGLRRMGDPETVIGPDGGQTVFSPSRIFNARAFQSGGAGAVGSADDLFRFFDSLRDRGGAILNPDIHAQAIMNQIGSLRRDPKDAGQRFGYLGAVVTDPAAARLPQAPGTIRWGGVYGHDWFVDFANGIVAVMMTNTTLEGCTGAYPRELTNAIYGA